MTPRQIAGMLQSMCNKYGDFKVCRAWKDEQGKLCWSKHRSIMELWETDWGIEWLGQVNNRQILPIEIVLDLDNGPTEEQFNKICNLLENNFEHYKAYHTGSKGYHIHLINKDLLQMDSVQRKEMKKRFVETILGLGDLLKIHDNTMIALEGAPHWKTGIEKRLVRKYPYGTTV